MRVYRSLWPDIEGSHLTIYTCLNAPCISVQVDVVESIALLYVTFLFLMGCFEFQSTKYHIYTCLRSFFRGREFVVDHALFFTGRMGGREDEVNTRKNIYISFSAGASQKYFFDT